MEFVLEALSDLSIVALLRLGGRQQQPHEYRSAITSGTFVNKRKGVLHTVSLNVPSGDFCLHLHSDISNQIEMYASLRSIQHAECFSLFRKHFQRQFLENFESQQSSSSLILSTTWHI